MTLALERIRGLCFDVDGTLSDTDDLYAKKFEPFFRPFRPLLRQRDSHQAARRFVMWAEAPGNRLIAIPDRLGWDDELFAIAEWVNKRRNPPMKHYLLIDGVREMLAALHPHFPMTVVSAREERSTRAFLDQFELTPFFQEIVTAVTVERSKPFPDPILYAAQKMGVQPAECLMIGDTPVDILAGRAAGAQTVGVLCGFGEEDELRQLGADLILASTAQLSEVLLPK
ncbi:MAG: HAD family hydrolase [Anaerolineales bacterium]|jgi:HAD superfamily hydrolase (TIGR01509 family)|nr:HAD family hydrolase [Anaerolineales bacterium]